MLSKPESFISAGDPFNLAKSSSHKIFMNVINVISNLRHEFIIWPNEEERLRISRVLHERSGKTMYLRGV